MNNSQLFNVPKNNNSSAPREWRKLLELIPENELEFFSKNIPAGERPLWLYWKEFVESRRKLEKSIVTVRNVRDSLRFLIRHTSFWTIEKINDANSFGDMLLDLKEKRGQSLTTRNTYLKNVRTYFIWLERRSYISVDTTKKIERPSEKRKEQFVLSAKQIDEIIGYISRKNYTYKIERRRDLFYVNLLRHTGARPSEIRGLKIGCIRKKGNSWKITVDGAKQKPRPRVYNLPSYVLDSYFDYMKERGEYNPPFEDLFISRTGKPLTYYGMQQILRRITREMKFPSNSYGFRRFVASRLNQARLPIKDISRYLGHTRESTTELYIERSGTLTQRGTEIMGEIANSSNENLNSENEVQSTSTSASSNKQDKSSSS